MSSASERSDTGLWTYHFLTPPPSGGVRRSVGTAEFARVLAPHVFTLWRFLWLEAPTAESINSVGAGTERERAGGTPGS